MKVASLSMVFVLLGVMACGDSPPGIAGRIEYQFNGGPVSGAKVKVGNGPVVTTDPGGRFLVQAPGGPYDVTAVSADGSSAAVYVGLTRPDPIVSIPLEGPGSDVLIHSAVVTGRFVGGIGVPFPAGHTAQGFFTGPASAAVQIADTTLRPDGTYTTLLNWRGDANLSGTLRVIEWLVDFSTGLPASFDAAGSVPVTIASGQRLTGKDINFTAVGNFRITGTISLAQGSAIVLRQLNASFPPSSDFATLGFDVSPDAAFDYPAFNVPGGVFNLTALVQDSTGGVVQAWRAGFSPATPINLSVPAAPTFQAPAFSLDPGAVAGITLSWSALDGAVYDVVVHPLSVQPPTPGPVLRIVTGATTFELPDLSAMGVVWPRPASYRVDLLAAAPLSPDDVAGGLTQLSQDHDGVLAQPAPIAFTTTP